MHKSIVKAAGRSEPFFERLPKPFKTIIPNATKIAEATDPEASPQPGSFSAKCASPFAKLFEAVCDEIVKRAEWTVPAQKRDVVGAKGAPQGQNSTCGTQARAAGSASGVSIRERPEYRHAIVPSSSVAHALERGPERWRVFCRETAAEFGAR